MLSDLSYQELLIIFCALAYGFGVVKWLLSRNTNSDKKKEEESIK
jgi:hypothetical protein